ncbi:hypothetical protein D3C72_2244900 [compost metagenome]
MHALDQIGGVQQVGLARAGGGAAYVHAAHCAISGQNGCATRGAAAVGEVTDLDTLHQGDGARGRKLFCVGRHGPIVGQGRARGCCKSQSAVKQVSDSALK